MSTDCIESARKQLESGPSISLTVEPGSGDRFDGTGAVLEAQTTGAQIAVFTPEPYLQIANPGTPTTAPARATIS